MSNLLQWLTCVYFSESGGGGLRFLCFASCFVSNTWRVCSVKLQPTWEMKRIRWSGGPGVAIASWKSFFLELVASTNGNQCKHDQKTGVVVQALPLTDQGLWFQEPYGAFMSFCRSQHHSPLQLQKGSCSCSCGGHVYWERGSMLEAGLLPLGSAGQPGSLLHVEWKPSMGWT